MPPSQKRPASDTTGNALKLPADEIQNTTGKAFKRPAGDIQNTTGNAFKRPAVDIQKVVKKTHRFSRPWEGPPISRGLAVVDALSSAFPGNDHRRAATFATVSLSGFAPGPTLGMILQTLSPSVTCTAEAVGPAGFNSAMLSIQGHTVRGAFPWLPRHAVKLEGGTFECLTCKRENCIGNVDILLLDGVPADGDEATAVERFVNAVTPRIQICFQPYTERKAAKTVPNSAKTVAESYGLPIAAPILETFTGRDSVTATRCREKFNEVNCSHSVHPETLLEVIPASLTQGVDADLPGRDSVTADVDGEDRVLAEWKERGWVKPDLSRDAFTAVLRDRGKDLQAQGFALFANKLAEARLRAAMLRQLVISPDSFAIASTGKTAVFHVDGSLPDFRDAKVNPVVSLSKDVVRTLSFIDVMALRGYHPELHNLSTEPLGTRSLLAAKAFPAPLWVMALLAAVTQLNAH